MATYYCNSCSVEKGLLAHPPEGKLVGSPYQREKFEKHTESSTGPPELGVFVSSSTALYRDLVLGALERGFIEFDDKGRRNVICPTTEHTGYRFEHGDYVRDTDSIAVVRSTSSTGIHAFPVNSTSYAAAYCDGCEILVIR